MSATQKFIPHKGIDVDSDELYLTEANARFIKNITYEVNDNNSAPLDEGSNAGAFTPLESNTRLCDLTLPTGKNFCIGYYESRELAEGYVFVWNSNNDHLIYRINGRNGQCEKVYQSKCLNFQLIPKHFIAEGRCVLQTTAFVNKVTDKEETRKYLIFTDDFNPQRFISVEDAIITNGFDANLYPYFLVNDPVCDKCTWINLGVQPPMDCIEIDPIKRNLDDEEEKNRPNLLNYKSWQFRIKYIDVWGRESEHGVISDMYISTSGGGCVSDSNGLPRCLKLKFKAGCPFVDKIQIEFRNCNGNVRGLSINSDWYLYDVIDKWNDCEEKPWYERSINNAYQREYDRLILLGLTPAEAAEKANTFLRYDAVTNKFEYTFCGDKECSPLPVEETNRGYNPLPLTSSSVFSIGKSIGLARNRRGFEPLDCKELDKIDFSVTPPSQQSNCGNNELRKITVWAVIWNPFEDSRIALRSDSGRAVFGISDCSKNNPFTYQQILPPGQEGFIGYLAGTKHYSVSKQYRHDYANNDDVFVGLNYNTPGGPFNAFNFAPLQKFEFEVLPGKYVFRIAGHRSSPNDDYQKTSTYLKGQTQLNGLGNIVREVNEILIDVCTGDAEIKSEPFMIYDLTRIGKGCAVAEATNVVEGYIREDEINKYPIELAKINPSNPIHFRSYTDHNGHYFAATRKKGLYVDLLGTKNCQNNQFLAKSDTSWDNSETWYRYNELYAYKNETKYPVGDRFLIKGKIALCDNVNVGVAGALVVLTRGQFAYADANGEFTIIAHEKGDTGGRVDKIIYSQRGTCQVLACGNDCEFCFNDVNITSVACTGQERIFSVPDLLVKIKGLNKRGPQIGGRYGLGIKLHDWMGRHTFIQASEKHYVNIPTLQQTQVFDYSTIGFNIGASIQLPDWVRWISFYITENLNYDDFLTWVAERVQFVDNTGKVNTAAPTQIRLYYEGLGEYNKQNNFSTNSVWQFINSSQAPVLGDQIEFLANGDGNIFTKRITALLKYDKEGKYIAIDYTDELKDLKDGALIKLIRPKQCINKDFYYELCPIIRVVDGKPVITNGTFNFFDSYFQTRQIPVPVEKKTTNSNGEIETTTENQLRNYPFLFEHHSPSDFWGDHCWNKGRVNTKNPYENQQLLKTEIAISDAIANNGVINGLNYFTDADKELFDEQEWGGITTVLAEINNLLIICEHDNFVVTYNDDDVRVDENGRVYAPGADSRFGRPQRKIGNNFGCELDDINTIRRKDGMILFIDRSKSAIVVHNYADAVDISAIGVKSWIKTKVKYLTEYNAQNNSVQKYLHAVIDPKRNEYLITSFNINPGDNADADFVNQLREIKVELNETLAFDVYAKVFKTFYSFTPEYYGTLEGQSMDNQLLSMRRGEVWYHHRLRNPGNTYNNFYGTQCEWVLEVVANMDNTKVKRYLWNEFYCKEIKVYIDRIITEAGQQSRLMPKWWDRREKFWAADFKCAINTNADTNILEETTINALLDGDVLYGRWLMARYVPHPDFKDKYFELTAILISMIGSEKSSIK